MMRFRGRRIQPLRRTVQLAVVALLLLVPALARYNNYLSARELDRVLERWSGTLPGAALSVIDTTMRALPGGETERAGRTQRDRARVLEYGQQVRGGPWSAEIAGVSMTDPLAAAESVAAHKTVPWPLLLGLLLPLVLTLLLGRVFCSWICPMGFLLELTDKLRGVLRFLEIRPRNVRVSRGVKYGVLAAGLLLTAALGVPLLGYLYPPAVMSRETHAFVYAVFDRAEQGRFALTWVGLSWMAVLLAAIAAFEVLVSRRWWCRYVCPGGALYSLLGRARPVRVRLAATRCTRCAQCVAACPMGLNPMNDRMGMECDSCGLCIRACDDDALAYTVGRAPHEPAPEAEAA